MKRTQIKRIGKTGRANIEARKKIADIAEQMGLNYCEIGLQGCLVTSFLAPRPIGTREVGIKAMWSF